jgi:hypothetical protein
VRVLVACEYSGVVRDAFIARGHDAMSCDLLPTEVDGPHYEGNVMDVIGWGWDLMIAHPPCTYLTNSGVRWLYSEPNRWKDLIDGACFFRDLLYADIPKIAIENPVMHGYATRIIGREHNQIIQPWMFWHPETKGTALWLRGLRGLQPTKMVREEMKALPPEERHRIHHVAPGPDRWKIRSTTYTGIAEAMASQWG